MNCIAMVVLAVAVVRMLAVWAAGQASAPMDLKLRAARIVAAVVGLVVEVAPQRSPSAECTLAAEMPSALAG